MSAYSIATRGLAGRKVPQGVLATMDELLFAASEPGAWYDPSDMSTLFQDSAGTTPVTAVEQPVGLMLDKSKGLILGPQLVANGDFSSGTAGWTATTATISAPAGKLIIANDASGTNVGWANATVIPTVVGRTYRLTFDFEKGTANQGAVVVGTTPRGADLVTFGTTNMTATGSKSAVFVATTAQTYVTALNNTTMASGTSTFDNIFVHELLGNHAIQGTTTKRPVLSRRVNLLTKTEDFTNAVWIKNGVVNTSDTTVAPDGIQSADKQCPANGVGVSVGYSSQTISKPTLAIAYTAVVFAKRGEHDALALVVVSDSTSNRAGVTVSLASGAITVPASAFGGFSSASAAVSDAGNGWYRVELSFTTDAIASITLRTYGGFSGGGLGDGVAGIYAWGASLTLATDAHLPYQYVNTASDYDADPAKYPAYLRFDGVDDALQTGNIDFTGTDKMTVWAGVTKLSDAAGGVITHTGIYDSTPGFLLTSPASASAANMGFRVRRSALGPLCTVSGLVAPVNCVLAGHYDAVTTTARANGSQTIDASAAGAGNFASRPLWIGSQDGLGGYFNGRIYSLIVRGTQSSLSQIEATEAYIKQKMRLS